MGQGNPGRQHQALARSFRHGLMFGPGTGTMAMRDAGSLIAKLRRVWVDARPRRITNVSVAVAIIISMLTADAGWSQAARTIRIVVTVAPGGAVDFLARVLAE